MARGPLKLFILCRGCSNVAFTPQWDISWHWPRCEERSWGKPCQELWLKYKKCNQSSYLGDFFKSTRNPFDTLSLQLSPSASAVFLGNRISPMNEGFLKQKENVEVVTAWI